MAGRTTRITVSLPSDLLEAAGNRLAREGEGTSALVRRLFEAALRDAEEQERVRQYMRGYQEAPQTDEEFGWADAAGREAVAEGEWK